jgi:hypothetical protein
MTQDDMVKVARDCGIGLAYGRESIERFYTFVAAAEREACAKIADKCIEDSEKVTPESEQEENYMVAMRILSEEFAIAIRARGDT